MRASRVLPAALSLLALFPLVARSGGTCNSTPNVASVGSGTGGVFGVVQLAGLGTPDIDVASSFAFQISGGVPHAPGVLIVARREQPIVSSTFQTTIYTGEVGLAVPFVCDANGNAAVAPNPTSHPIADLCGLDLIAQATVFDFTAPGGSAWTNGLRFRFGSQP